MSTKPKVTAEDLKDMLSGLGLAPGAWGELAERLIGSGPVAGQKDALIRLRVLFEGLVEQEQQAVARLKEQLVRLQHGGGS